MYPQCYQVVERLDHIGLLKEEYCLLKALVLVNADTKIEDPTSVRKLRETVQSSLCDCIMALR